MMAAMPTAPAPNTAIVLPGSGRSTFMTAPAPVWMPQPRGARTCSGASSGTLTRQRSSTSACRASDDCPKKWPCSGRPPWWRVWLPSARVPPKRLSAWKLWQ